jgi:hypothetical protein
VVLLEAARAAGIDRIVFSSTAAVYGVPDATPIPEDAPLRPINPYGETKRTFEGALAWYGTAYGIRKKLLRDIAGRVHETAMLPTGIPANDLPAIYKEFSGFKKSIHWLGYKSLRRLTQAIVELHPDLIILEDEDSWSVARTVFAGFLSDNGKGRNLQTDTSVIGLRDQVATWLKNLVGASPTPMALNVLAQSVMRRFGDQDVGSGWLGAGSFKNLLQQLDLEPLQLSSEGPSYLYDPNQHSFSVDEQVEEEVVVEPANQDAFAAYPNLAPLAKKIHRLTDTPYLIPEHYAILFNEIAREVNERGYKMTRTSRAVRDQCIEHGAPIARSHVNFVLTGLYYIGYRLGAGSRRLSARPPAIWCRSRWAFNGARPTWPTTAASFFPTAESPCSGVTPSANRPNRSTATSP